MKKVIRTSNAPLPLGPYSQGIMTGDFLFISGQVGMDPVVNKLISDNIEDQIRQIMTNHKNILEVAGMDFSNVVRCTIFLVNLEDFPVVNQIYGQYFKENPPSRETVEVSRLPLNAQVEISMIASK